MEHTNNSYAKRTKIFGMIFFIMISIVTILSSLSFITALPVYCYQESASVANQSGTDGSCTLNYTGYYNSTNNTGGAGASNNFIYMTYKIPQNASSAIWLVKHGNYTTPYNVTIPRDCFIYDNTWLRLRFTSLHQIGGVYNSYSYGQCLDNGGNWRNITLYSFNSSNTAYSISFEDNTTQAYDGNWNTKTAWHYDTLQAAPTNFWNPYLNGGSSDYSLLYEEGIYWVMGPSVYLISPANNSLQLFNNVNFSCSTNDSNYFIRNTTLYTNASGVWTANKTTFGNVNVYDNFMNTSSICQPNQFIGPTCSNDRWNVYILTGHDYSAGITEPGDGSVNVAASGSSNFDIGLALAQLSSTSSFYQYAINVTYSFVSAENAWPLTGIVYGRIRLYGGGTLLSDVVACSQWLSDCSSVNPVYNDFGIGYWSINYSGSGNVWNLYKDGAFLRSFATSGDPQGFVIVSDAFAGTTHSRHSAASVTFRNMSDIQDNYLTNNPATFTNFYPAALQGINWNCKSCNSQGTCFMSPANYTFSMDYTPPSVNVTSPVGLISYAFIGQSINLNWSVSDNGVLNTCWFEYNGVNTTVPCNQNTTTFILAEPKSLTFYVNDSVNNVASTSTNWSYSVIEHSFNHADYAYETSRQNFTLNASSDTVNSASLVYNTGSSNITYPALSITNYSSYNIIYTSFDIPLLTGVSPYNRSFYWILNTSSGLFNTTTHYQNTYAINFTICQNPVNVTYLNISYKDEMHYNYINGSVQASSFNYWLGNGDVQKNIFYNNDTEVSNFPWCFSPPNQTVTVSYRWQAASLGYVVRNFQSITPLSLSSSYTNLIFWMISLSESNAVAITVIDTLSGNVIPDARVTITRDIQGNTQTVLDGFTDGAGTIATFLSTVVPYTITASKSGCGSNSKTVVPIQGTYQMNLNCQGGVDGNGTQSNLTKYVSAFDGLSFQRGPPDGITNPGTYTFTYWLGSIIYPIVQSKFTLTDQEGNIVASNETTAANGTICNSSSCYLTVVYTVAPGDNIKGHYYVNLGNGITNGTYALIESDAYWRFIIINQNNSQQAWTKFTIHLNEFLTVWGGNQTNCIPYNTNTSCALQPDCKWVPRSSATPNITGGSTSAGICVLKDDSNKAEFNRIIVIFFAMVIILFIMGKFIGFELTNPGSFVSYMAIIIVILSMGGLFNFAGLTGSDWFNKYIYAIICVEIAVGYNIAIIRRYSM